MKKHILAAFFSALNATGFAVRPSSDEVAIRLGVREWFSARSSNSGQFDFARLQTLYRADLEFTEPGKDPSAVARGFDAYTASLGPFAGNLQKLDVKLADDLRVTLNGSSAVTEFTFRPQGTYRDGRAVTCAARVSLTWERRDGFWQIAREHAVPLAPTPAQIATAQ